MNWEQILEYQEVELQLRQVMKKIAKSPLSEKKDKARDEFNKAKSVMQDCEQNADKIYGILTANDTYIELNNRASQLVALISECDDILTMENEIEELKIIKKRLLDCENKFADYKQRAENVVKEYMSSRERAVKMKEIHEKSLSDLKELENAEAPQIESLKSKMEALEKEVDKKLLDIYTEAKNNKVFPVFVPLNGGTCGGCGMELSQNNKGELKDKGMCKCETCRRIVFVK